MTRAFALALMLGLAPLPLIAAEAGDAVFAERGPWDLGDRTLEWQMTVTGPMAEGFRPTEDGRITLSQDIDPSDQQPILELTQKAGPIDRIAEVLPYADYVGAETILRMRQTTGERSGMFRGMAALTETVATLRRAEAEAEIICF